VALNPAVRTTLRRVVVGPAPAVHAAVAVPFALGISVPPVVRYAPFVVSVLLLGLPHGAVDHLAVLRARGGSTPVGLQGVLAAAASPEGRRVGLIYAVLGGAYLGGFLLAPTASFAFFVVLTWFHWGQGDLYALVAFVERTHLRTRGQRALAVVVRGGLPMLVPLLGGPAEVRQVAEAVVGLFGRDPAALAVLFRPDVRLALGVGFGALTLGALAFGYRRVREIDAGHGTGDRDRARDAWRLDAVETLALWGFFLAVPPLLAVGLYFCLWHSARHVARLVALDAPAAESLAAGRVLPSLVRFARDAAPMTAGALAVMAGIYALVPAGVTTLSDLVAVYLVLLAVLTLPHVVVVLAMDREQDVWGSRTPNAPGH